MESTISRLDKQAIGDDIKAQRETHEMTQEQVAARFGWNKQVISDIESGKAVSLEKLLALSTLFDLSFDRIRNIGLKQ